MRVLIVGENNFLEKGLKSIGVDVDRWVPEYDKGLTDALSKCRKRPDVVLINENLGKR